ncbi:hypothetical protein CGLO_00783 [Colletotrichum gloeosporioides Cg-14]|uniref:Uncharacterized protein n=1 Tax=Colletotrichum gloeosporioides (strain Cg-14) TaxID=1237896 RepID=T0L342_COLGC|nr:hypothetical protein CGLO_00783 [Colletotrichum gloeosporioides Cg-14]
MKFNCYITDFNYYNELS